MSKILRVTINAFHFGQQCQNRLHFLYTDDTNLSYLQDMAQGIQDEWITAIRPAINNECIFQSIKVDDLSAGPLGPTFTKQIAIPGSAGTDSASPTFFSVVLQLLTGKRGRGQHGRVMMPAQSPGQFSLNIMNSLGIARWTTPVSNLRNLMLLGQPGNDGNNYHLILSSGAHGLDQLREVTDIMLRTTPGTQNSRKVGVGN